jgi:sugar lactone lactonase YvrE
MRRAKLCLGFMISVVTSCGQVRSQSASGGVDAGDGGGGGPPPPGLSLELLAGDISGPGNADGMGAAARFFSPIGVAVDSAGNVYVADTSNHTIRKITPAGVVTTLAGTANQSGYVDGTGTAARFTSPAGVAVDSTGNLYVADTGNHIIRKISASGSVSTVAGTAGQKGAPMARAAPRGSVARRALPSTVPATSMSPTPAIT